MNELVLNKSPIQLPTRRATMIETRAAGVYSELFGRMMENIKYYNALIDTIAEPGLFTSPVGRNTNVIEIGPKEGIVVPAILAFFSGAPLTSTGLLVNYTGIDISEKDIRQANKKRESSFPLPQVRFVVGDARYVERVGPIQQADIVICRHPSIEIADSEDRVIINPVWEELFTAWQKKLTDDGKLIVTTYWPGEFDKVKTVLADHIPLEGSTRSEGSTDTDQYICVAGKYPTAKQPILLKSGFVESK